ncbi:hypothetical protein AB0I68_14680 [Streptomyces sp. NPDC050448]|uniref:hypothetical protein n=1 Tax=Streptomyces sp. NPDC050448 TaxID=3155404 RepID=UPI003413E1D7
MTWGGLARWNPQSQQWELPEDREESQESEPGAERPQLPPKPARPPDGSPDGAPPDAPPAPSRARRWWTRSAIALGLAATLGGAALAASYVVADPGVLPDGYQVLRSAGSGFRVAVPPGWQLSTSEPGTGAGAVFRPAQGRGSLLHAFRVAGGPDNPCEVLVESSSGVSSRDGYRRLSLGARQGRGCEIVYEIPDGDTGGTARCIGRLLVASDGSRWVLTACGPAGEAKTVRVRLAAALASFRPD